jgi:hypothetical protein
MTAGSLKRLRACGDGYAGCGMTGRRSVDRTTRTASLFEEDRAASKICLLSRNLECI